MTGEDGPIDRPMHDVVCTACAAGTALAACGADLIHPGLGLVVALYFGWHAHRYWRVLRKARGL